MTEGTKSINVKIVSKDKTLKEIIEPLLIDMNEYNENLSDLIQKLKSVQENTNNFLTELINSSHNCDKSEDGTEEENSEDESDESTERKRKSDEDISEENSKKLKNLT